MAEYEKMNSCRRSNNIESGKIETVEEFNVNGRRQMAVKNI
jgi:hypothetical protein